MVSKALFFLREFVLKDFCALPSLFWQRLLYWYNPHIYGLNPPVDKVHRIALLLIPGADGNPSSFLPLAKTLQKIAPVYTSSFKQTEEDLVPTETVRKRIQEIGLPVILVGHSLGGIIALDLAEETNVKAIVTLGARIKHIPCSTSWFCRDLIKRIDSIYHRFNNNIPLVALWGTDDGLVPKESALPEKATRKIEIPHASHLGILYKQEALTAALNQLLELLAESHLSSGPSEEVSE